MWFQEACPAEVLMVIKWMQAVTVQTPASLGVEASPWIDGYDHDICCLHFTEKEPEVLALGPAPWSPIPSAVSCDPLLPRPIGSCLGNSWAASPGLSTTVRVQGLRPFFLPAQPGKVLLLRCLLGSQIPLPFSSGLSPASSSSSRHYLSILSISASGKLPQRQQTVPLC